MKLHARTRLWDQMVAGPIFPFSGLMNPLFAIDVRLKLDSEKILNQERRPDRIGVLIDESGKLTAEDVFSKRESYQRRVDAEKIGLSSTGAVCKNKDSGRKV